MEIQEEVSKRVEKGSYSYLVEASAIALIALGFTAGKAGKGRVTKNGIHIPA